MTAAINIFGAPSPMLLSGEIVQAVPVEREMEDGAAREMEDGTARVVE